MAPHTKTQQTCKNHTTRLKIIATAFQHTNQFMHASCICCIQPGVVCTYAWDTCVMITGMNRSQLSSGPNLLGYMTPTTDWHSLILLVPNQSKWQMVKQNCP